MKPIKTCKEEGCKNFSAPGRSRCYPHYGQKRRAEEKTITPKAPDGQMKILMIDIETYPDKGYFWGIWNQNIGINQISDPGGLLCFAAKWYGQDEIEFYSLWDHGNDGMARELWRLMNEADVVVHFYGSRFDVPHINTHLLKLGFGPYRPFKQVDLKMAVSKRFRFTSNKLQFVSEVLGLEGKEEHEGFPLWDKVMNEPRRGGIIENEDGTFTLIRPYTREIELDAKARMTSYNKQDVFLLDEVFEILLPWIPNFPHRHLYEEGTDCPSCGDGPVLEDGYTYTKLSKFRAFQCLGCNSRFRSSRREFGVEIQELVL